MYENVPRIKEAIRLIWGEEDIVPPGAVLLNDRPEFFAIKRERLWAFSSSVGAGAGRPQVDVANEPVPGGLLIVVVTMIKVVNATAGTYALTLDAAQAGAPTANISRDPRNSGIQSKNRILNTAAQSGTVIDNKQFAGGADGLFDVLPVILTQAHRLTVFGVNAAAMTVVGAGYEFNGRAEELALA